MADKPQLSYWHVYTDDEGVSRQVESSITGFGQESMGGDADEQWNRRLRERSVQILFAVHPSGWEGDWHENPKAQFIVPLSGRWFVETMDGTRTEMGPGELSFGADQGCQERNGKKGHRSGVVGDEPAVLLVVQLPERYRAAQPGIFKEV